MKRFFVIATVVVSVLAISGLIFAQANPFLGTWKLNIAKSKYDPGPPPKSQTRTIEAAGAGQKVSTQGVAADGSRVDYQYTCGFDGKDCPETGAGIPNGSDTISRKQVNANTTEAILKKGGQVLYTTRTAVSKDGKTMTLTAKGKNVSGQALNNVLVYDKQ